MAKAVRSLSPKQIAERTQQHRQAVIQLATYRARKAIEAQIRALGKRPTTYSPAQLKALAQAELELNRISLMAEAEKTIATSPLFTRWRLPGALCAFAELAAHKPALDHWPCVCDQFRMSL